MEAFGRLIAVCTAALGVCFCVLFYRRCELVRCVDIAVQESLDRFVDDILKNQTCTEEDRRRFENSIHALGNFEAECMFFIGEGKGSVATKSRSYQAVYEGSVRLSSGDYVRILVRSKENALSTILFGEKGIYLSGGRIA